MANRQEVLDITLANRLADNRISNWRVGDEESSSDHRYIRFILRAGKPVAKLSRNIRKVDWGRFQTCLKEGVRDLPRIHDHSGVAEINTTADLIHKTLLGCLDKVCPLREYIPRDKVAPWWTGELTRLHAEASRLWKRLQGRRGRDPA